MKVNADKRKVLVLGEERFGFEICLDGMWLEQVSEFKYLVCVLNESGAGDAKCNMEVTSKRKVAMPPGHCVGEV